jgi:polyamine oxidase
MKFYSHIFGILTLALSACSVVSDECTTTVTIIGAGAAGVSAAKILNDAGIDFVVVEAKDTVGGRVADVEFAGYTVENGANWIHGPLHAENGDNNPLWDYKLLYGLEGNYSDYSNWKIQEEDGSEVPQGIAEKWWNRMHTAFDHCEQVSYALWESACDDLELEVPESIDIPLEQCLREYGYWNGTEGNVLEEDIANLMEWIKIDFEYSNPSSAVSTMWGFPINGEFEPRDFLVTDPRGYGFWMDEIAAEFSDRIHLSKTVTSIENRDDNKVRVETEDGTVFVSDYTICTLPLGVLQSGDVEFIPPFSDTRIDGINGMTMSNYAKLYLQFETRFWGDEEVILTAGDLQSTDLFPWAVNLDLPKFLPGSKILSFNVCCETARIIETQPKEITVAHAIDILERAYGSETVSKVTASHVTNWTNDRYSYGSYADWPIGYTEEQHINMVEPFGNVYFAGGHTDSEFYGFLHGAIYSGQNKSNTVLEMIPTDSRTQTPTMCPTKTVKKGKNGKKNKKAKKDKKS